MKLRIIAILTALMLLFSCAQAARFEEASFGMGFELPDGVSIADGYQKLSAENGLGVADLYCGEMLFAELVVLDDEIAPQLYNAAEELISSPEAVHQNGLTYLLLTTNEELDEVAAAALEDIQAAFANADYFTPVPFELANSKLSFSTIDLNGDAASDSVFTGKKVTMINIWSTTCNPCLNEMPELAKMRLELDENAGMFFLCCDLYDLDDGNAKNVAETVVERAGIPAESIWLAVSGQFTDLLSTVVAVPTTIFVDGEGRILEEKVIGANVEAYAQIINEQLSK